MNPKTSVLVADDEQSVRGLIKSALEFIDFDVIEALNGEEAVQLAQKNLPDLVLLDVRMPKMDGFEACEALKADEATNHIPIVFLSAHGQQGEIDRGLSLGAEEYIVKPFSVQELVIRINRILIRHDKFRP